MSSETVLLPLSSVVRNDSPITYGVVKPGEEDPNGVAFIRSGDVSGGVIDPSVLRTITDDVSKQYRRTLLEGGEILVSLVGTPGQAAIVPSSLAGANIARQVALVRVDPSHSTRYVFYCLTSKQGRESLLAHSRGSVQQVINLGDLQTVEIPVPPFAEQQAIAHILGTLDDKIELNRKTNETLEAMAKALFKSWFVDFDPVRAKAEGRPTGLPAEISDLFPDSFEDSELGEIPSGWRDGEIQDVAELNPETWGSRNQPLSVRYLDLSNVKHGKIDSVEEYQWEDAPSRARRILKTGDTVVGTVRPGNGSYCLIGEDGITGSTGFAVLRPKNKNDSAFVYLGSCSKENIDRLAHLADGGAYPAVRPELVAQTPVIIAARDLLDCFSRSVSPLFAAAEERKRSSKLLCQARDALLPKLISGEIRIPDAEKMLEEVGV
jgi:type I restriction enzyme, S subunit